MLVQKRNIAAVVAVLVIAGGGYADMTPFGGPWTEAWQTSYSSEPTDYPCILDPDSLLNRGFSCGGRLPDAMHELDAGCPHTVAREPSRTALCIYALLSLGLFRSVPAVKKLPLGYLRGWCRCSVPHHIDSTCGDMYVLRHAVPACPPPPSEWAEHEAMRQYRLRSVISFWQQMRLVCAVIVPRGPPARGRRLWISGVGVRPPRVCSRADGMKHSVGYTDKESFS